jgi:hypothetical protein
MTAYIMEMNLLFTMPTFKRPTLFAISVDSDRWPVVVPSLALWAALTARADFILRLVVDFNDISVRGRSGGCCLGFLLLPSEM